MAAIKDVAKLAGVSVAAVSKYLKTPNNMREDTRQRIAHAIEELNYRPNPFAQSLRTGKTNIIAIAIPELDNPYFNKMFKLLQEFCEERGYMAILLKNATVVSPIKGRIQSINESGTDRNGNPAAYITIQEVGSYRVKGTIGELQRGSIIEGTRIKITSRTDPSAAWTGTVKLVDYESPSQGSDTDRYYGMSTDSMSASSKYPFYVELDSTDGLILGQHVYLEMLTEGDGTSSGLPLSSAFICFEDDGSAYVWAEKKGKLEKRSITLGEHDEATDTYDVLDGLTLDDYIAFPDEQLCHNGAPTTHEMTVSENADMPMDNMGEGGMDMPMEDMPMEDMPMEDMPMEDMPAEGMDMMPEESISGETGEMPGEDMVPTETVSTEGGVG